MTTARRPLAGVVLLCVALVGLGGCGAPFAEKPTVLEIELADSAGLFVGNDVGVLGVTVGTITKITPRGKVAVATVEVDPDVDIPADAGAVVVSRSMATDRYVELTPVYDHGPEMASGATIPVTRTRTPVEWDQVLGTLDTLSTGLAGEDGTGRPFAKMLDAAAKSLDGNGTLIRDSLDNLVTGTDVLSHHQSEADNVLDGLDTLTAALAQNDALARDFISNMSTATALAASERANLRQAVDSLSRTLSLLSTFVRHHRDDLRATVLNVEGLARRVERHQEPLIEALEVLPVALENLGRAVNGEGRLDVKLPPQFLSPIPAVTDALCAALPPVMCAQFGTEPDLGALLGLLTRRILP